MLNSLSTRAHVRRRGRFSVVDIEGLATATVSSRLDSLGLGAYQLVVLLGVGCASLCESLEMGAVAPMHTALAEAFALSPASRTALPLFVCMGGIFGMLLTGPLCDKWGRKDW